MQILTKTPGDNNCFETPSLREIVCIVFGLAQLDIIRLQFNIDASQTIFSDSITFHTNFFFRWNVLTEQLTRLGSMHRKINKTKPIQRYNNITIHHFFSIFKSQYFAYTT